MLSEKLTGNQYNSSYHCLIPTSMTMSRCSVAFPEDYKTLVPKMLTESISSLSTSFVSRINLATGDVIPETRALHKGLNTLIPSTQNPQWFNFDFFIF